MEFGHFTLVPPQKAKRKRSDKNRPFLFVQLLLDDRFGRALSRASAALKALLGVDLVMQVAHIDRFGRALSCASAAGQALIGNNKSHGVTSVCIFGRSAIFAPIVTHLLQKSIEKFGPQDKSRNIWG